MYIFRRILFITQMVIASLSFTFYAQAESAQPISNSSIEKKAPLTEKTFKEKLSAFLYEAKEATTTATAGGLGMIFGLPSWYLMGIGALNTALLLAENNPAQDTELAPALKNMFAGLGLFTTGQIIAFVIGDQKGLDAYLQGTKISWKLAVAGATCMAAIGLLIRLDRAGSALEQVVI